MTNKILKNLLIAAAIFTIASCKSKMSKDSQTQANDQQDLSVVENPENYQTIADEKQADLIDEQTQTEIEEVEVQDRVFFGYDSSKLSEDAKKILTTQAEWLKSDPSVTITIEGHCDERGTREYNLALGEKRANSARSFLVSNGVEISRIKVISYGKERPAFFGGKDESLAKNRRAVTVVN